MSAGSLFRRISLRRLQLGPVGRIRGCPGCSRTTIECLRRIDKTRSGQRRTLLTAVTNSPNILTKYPEETQPPPTVLPALVDAAISWAAESHTKDDPPSNAIILVHKGLIPQGRDELLDALGQSTRLGGLDALVGVVDTVGEGAKGVSVLLASQSEDVSIDTLEGVQNEVLRVGKWHAKDVETEETMSFDDILASIRGGTNRSAATPETAAPSSTEDSVFVVGEMEAVQTQASLLNQRLVELTEDGNYFGTDTHDQLIIHYAGLQWSNDAIVKCCAVQNSSKSEQGISFSVSRTQHILVIGRTHCYNNKVTLRCDDADLRFSGNLILEIDNKPAMPYLLSLLPPQTEEEKFNPIPLIAKLPSTNTLDSLYLNVLGGSSSRGGIALDPLVASGRLSKGVKVEFGRLRQAYLASVKRPQHGVHVQLECVSPFSRRWEPENEKWGKYKRVEEGFEKQQRYKGLPEITYNKRLEYQGLQRALFSAGSEGGFLVGEGGVVPWLVRTQGSRLIQQLTPYEIGQRRTPIGTRPTRQVSVKRPQFIVKQTAQLREFLKARQLILSKRTIPTDKSGPAFPPWTTIAYLRADSRPETLTEEQKQIREEREWIKQQYKGRRRMWKARDKLKQLAQFQNHTFKPPRKRILPPEPRNYHGLTFQDLPPYLQRLFENDPLWNKYIPKLKVYTPKAKKIRRESKLRVLPKYLRPFIDRDPETKKFIEDGNLGAIRWFGWGQKTGNRRFGFRSRATWQTFSKKGFRRLDHRPGGLWVTPLRVTKKKVKSKVGRKTKKVVRRSGKDVRKRMRRKEAFKRRGQLRNPMKESGKT